MKIIREIFKSKPLLRATAAIIIGYAAVIVLGYYGTTYYFNNEIEQDFYLVEQEIETELDQHIDDVIEIESIFTEYTRDMSSYEFNAHAIEVLGEDFEGEVLFVAPGGIIEYVYPPSNTLDYIDVDYISKFTPLQRTMYFDAIEKDELITIYHFNNEDVITYLNPIYINGDFYGIAGIEVLDDQLLEVFDGLELESFNVVVRYDDEIIYGTPGDKKYLVDSNQFELEKHGLSISLEKKPETYNKEILVMITYNLGTLVFFGLSFLLVYREYSRKESLIKQLNYQNEFDLRTGLKNEKRMFKDANQMIDNGDEFYLVFGSLNNIKFIYDKFGRQLAEDIIIKTADLVQKVLTKKATLYHYGGDEYIFIFNNANKGEVINVLRKVTNIFNEDIVIDKTRANISFTMGITRYPVHGKTIEELVKNAHITHNRIKSHVRNNFEFFHFDSDVEFMANQDFDEYVSKLSINSFETYLMPVVEVGTDNIAGFECLSRAFDSFGNQLNIGNVVNSFERNGRIQELDEHTFKRLISIKKILNKKYDIDIALSANFSALSLNDEFVDNLIRIYRKADLKQSTILLELTESYKVEDSEYLIKLFTKLSNAGIKIAIDDFGSGYSSLTYISKFPIYGIKIDKQYVRDYSTNEFNRTLLATLQSISDVLNCSLVAEGVDDPETLEYLKENGCQLYQGFLFSKAVSFEDALLLLDENIKKGKQ